MMEVCARNVGGVWFGVASLANQVLATSFGSDKGNVLDGVLESVRLDVAYRVSSEPSDFAERVVSILRDVYDGKEVALDVPLDMDRLPAYTQRVLRAVSRIPLGYVASYGGVADAVGGGARAVGNCMANNPFPPIVPCHRVVTSSLGLGGYGGGLRVKFDFLRRERRGFTQGLEVSLYDGVLRVFPAEAVLQKLEKSADKF